MWPKFPEICLTVEGKPQKNLNQKIDPTGDRTRDCYVRSIDVTPKPQRWSFSNLSVALPTSQLILQTSRRFIYVTAHSPTLPLLHLRHSSFSNPSFASPTSQAPHLIHLASCPRRTGPTKALVKPLGLHFEECW